MTDDLRKADIKDLSDQELVDVCAAITNEVADIKEQIRDAKSRQYETGTYADPDWWRRSNTALKVKQRKIRLIQAEFKRRKEARRTEAAERPPPITKPRQKKEFVVENLTERGLDLHVEDIEAHLNDSSGQLVGLVVIGGNLLAVWLEYTEDGTEDD